MTDDPEQPPAGPGEKPPAAGPAGSQPEKPAPPKPAAAASSAQAGAAPGAPTEPSAPAKPAAPAAAKPAPKPAEPKAAPTVPTAPPDPPPPANVAVPGFIASLQARLGEAVSQVSYWVGDWTIVVPAVRLLDVAQHLREADDARFDFCSDVTASDWPARAQRFDVIYCLYSTRLRQRVRLKVRAADEEPVPSVTGIWPAANWLEREVYDLFGVNFTGHPDRRRILMPEEWQGFPQRKDYPLEGPGELLMENPFDWLKLRNARDEAEIE